jgi:hypothetical protein
MRCADGATRMCFPIIASFAADYEEQVIITVVKSGRHCTICTVGSEKREDLHLRALFRTHQSTQEQLKKQSVSNVKKNDENWVHPVENFAWKHSHLNIHQAMTLDPLHQLLKGVFKHLMSWILKELEITVKADRKAKGTKLNIVQANAVARLDETFRRVPRCQDLHIFQAFSQVQQWTGNEERSLIRQIIPVFAPVLLPKSPQMVQLAGDIDLSGYKSCKPAYCRRDCVTLRNFDPAEDAVIWNQVPRFKSLHATYAVDYIEKMWTDDARGTIKNFKGPEPKRLLNILVIRYRRLMKEDGDMLHFLPLMSMFYMIGNPLSIQHLRVTLREARKKSAIPWTDGKMSVEDLTLRILKSKMNQETQALKDMLDMAQLAGKRIAVETTLADQGGFNYVQARKDLLMFEMFPKTYKKYHDLKTSVNHLRGPKPLQLSPTEANKLRQNFEIARAEYESVEGYYQKWKDQGRAWYRLQKAFGREVILLLGAYKEFALTENKLATRFQALTYPRLIPTA